MGPASFYRTVFWDYAPSPVLQPYVAAYWLLSNKTGAVLNVPVVPDGCSDIIFHFNRDEPPHGTSLIYAQLERDGVEIMLQQQKSMAEDLPAFSGCDIGASVSFYIVVEDIAGLFEQVQGKVDCILEPETTWYAMREFYIRDPDGYVLGFAESQNK